MSIYIFIHFFFLSILLIYNNFKHAWPAGQPLTIATHSLLHKALQIKRSFKVK